LTVDDGKGHTNSETTVVNPSEPDGDPVSNIAFVGTASTVGNRTSHRVTLPGGANGINVGDTMVLFLSSASSPRTYTDPAGWTLLETKDGTSAMGTRAWVRTATQADRAGNVSVLTTSSAITKSVLTVAVYRGTDGTSPIATSASKVVNTAGSTHTSPTVTATDDTGWLVTYWADRSNNTDGFTVPAGVTVRQTGLASDTGSAHVAALLADSNGPVPAGPQGGLTATANGDSSRGASISIVLKSS
jgi:hypothetical protein